MRRFIPFKKGFRVLGVAESFNPDVGSRAALAGVIMRADGVIDGYVLGHCTVGGMDSTGSIIEMTRRLGREDINLLMLNGCVISLFNIVNLALLSRETGLPLICVTYNPSEGLDERIRERFPTDWEERLAVHRSNGEREEMRLRTGHIIYVRRMGPTRREALTVLNMLTRHGRIPEPLRLAKGLARALLEYWALS